MVFVGSPQTLNEQIFDGKLTGIKIKVFNQLGFQAHAGKYH